MSEPSELLPRDEHNQKLLSYVRPPDWRNPKPAKRYNLVVLGGGTTGLVAAAIGGALGAKTALVEKSLLGGECLNTGCVPSKALLRSGGAAAAVRRAADYGVRVPANAEVDFAAVMERLRRVRAEISPHDSAARLSEEFGVHVFLGEGRFTGPDTLEVAGANLNFKKAVIATGSRPAVPPVKGLGEAGYLSNETLFNLSAQPARLAVIGAGPQGCEMAQAFSRLGSEVFLIDQERRVLGRDDPEAAMIIERQLVRDRVRLKLDNKILQTTRKGPEKHVELQSGGRQETIAADEILIGTGRRPRVDGLGLDYAGIEYDNSDGILVDDYLQSSNARVYAAGDVCLPEKHTHTAAASAQIAVQNALLGGRRKKSAMNIPWCTYTHPEVAQVGLSEPDGLERGIDFDAITVRMDEVDRAVIDGETDGFVKVLFTGRSSRILGATIVAPGAGEIISGISIAMEGGVRLKDMINIIHPYPTYAEAVRIAAEEYQRGRLTAVLKKTLSGYFFLRRRRS
jgi:pyruvate/2-oxoglutarate dehydrogenase complex dihydrolipoamide dehydrogenase (E3) component